MAESPTPGQDTERFVRLLIDGQREILRYILALVPDMDDAHDILQDTAVDLWKKFESYDPNSRFVPWACRFALNHVLRYGKRRARQGKYLSLDVIDLILAERSEREPLLEERRDALATCLQALPESERLLIEQRYAERTTVSRMAEETGRSAATLYKALERIRRRLFECVNRRLGLGALS